ncbi:MAG: STM3941 family protein [Erythrobacter sp.]|jgi:hypothetical protein|nr:STM3941 family protein [Erythrobacter sp.]
MEEFTARPSRWRLGLLCASSLGFVVIGLVLALDRTDAVGQAIGWANAGFFGLCAGVIGRQAFDRRVQLRIGREGIQWTRWSDAVIGWDEIEAVGTWSHGGQRFIVLDLADPARFPGSGLQGWLAGANRRLTGGDIAIALTGTDRSVAEALAAIDHFGAAARGGSPASPCP